MKFNIGRIPRHYTFEYTPRFYNPEEEEAERRKVDYTQGDAGAKLKQQISHGLKSQRGSQFAYRTQRSQQSAASNKRLMFIILGFCFIGYLIWKSDRIENLLRIVFQAN